MLKPTIPSPGDDFSIFGITGKVAYVVPHDDWNWQVEVEVASATGAVEGIFLIIPTDFRTDDGTPAF